MSEYDMAYGEEDQSDLISDVTDLHLLRYLLASMHDDLPGMISRLRQLADLECDLGYHGTMIFGGQVAYEAWIEARSSFVHGNFVAVILLCQGLLENLLAAYLYGGLMSDDVSNRVPFRKTLLYCKERGVISGHEKKELEKLMNLRNPLSHFRYPNDDSNLDWRAIQAGIATDEMLFRDANFSIGLVIRILAKPAFRLG